MTSSAVLAVAGALIQSVVRWRSLSKHLLAKLLATSDSSKSETAPTFLPRNEDKIVKTIYVNKSTAFTHLVRPR